MAAAQNGDSGEGHLAYYTAQGISPVSYDTADMAAHLERRDSLYRELGLPPIAFKGGDILEVAPGSGQNSLYIASTMPASYDLVEPNPSGVASIQSAFGAFALSHTRPRIHSTRFEDFVADRVYDVVICENWLGSRPQERALLRRLPSLLARGGVLVITTVPPTGFFPNVFRKLLALRLAPPGISYAEQVGFLTEVFGAHLATMRAMTRSHEDWVKDCLLNPHYLNVMLPLETALEDLGGGLEALGSAPVFSTDWRWFKSLAGTERGFNRIFHDNYRRNLHNFVDSRRVFPLRSIEQNQLLDAACRQLHDTACAWQRAQQVGEIDGTGAVHRGVSQALFAVERAFGEIDAGLALTVAEMRTVWDRPQLEPSQIRDMENFAGLFGRETLYVSWTAPR